MNIKRIITIIQKDFTGGLGKTFFIMAIAVPIIMTLLVNLIFGKFFLGKPSLAVIDSGNIEMGNKIRSLESVIIKDIESEDQLQERIESGAIDGGIVLSKDFKEKLEKSELPKVKFYIGGESLASSRLVLATSLADLLREEVGSKLPIEIKEVTLGEASELPLKVKFIPLLIMYTIFIGGCTLPAALVVDEVEKKTVKAVTITSATLSELLSAKAIVGFFTSFIMGIITLLINQVFIGNIWLLIIFMLLGSFFAVELGLIIGSISKDLTTTWTYVKTLGFLIALPALLYLFPQVPEWISKLFPTYYLFNPIIEITQHAAKFVDVWNDILILLAFDIFFILFVFLGKRKLAFRD